MSIKNNSIDTDKTYASTNGQLVVSNLYKNRHDYCLNPIYQRKNVWKKKYQTKLLSSMIAGMKINTVHLSPLDEDKLRFNCIDGKQRISAIIDFMDDKISISYKDLIDKNWTQLNKLAAKGNKNAQLIVKKIEEYSIDTTVYNSILTLEEQADVFTRINYQESLTQNEIFFGQNYFVKDFINYIFIEKLFEKNSVILKHLKGDLKDNNRYGWITMIYEWLVLSKGQHFDASFQFKQAGQVGVKKFLPQSNSYLARTLEDIENPVFSDIELQKIGLEAHLKSIKMFLNTVNSLMLRDTKDGIQNSYNRIDIYFFVLYLLWVNDQHAIKESFLSNNFGKILAVWRKWVSSVDFKKTMSNYDAKTLEKGITFLSSLSKEFSLDFVVQKNIVSQSVRQSVINYVSENNIIDEKTGEPITVSNYNIDHTSPSSLQSLADYSITTKHTNIKKSNDENVGVIGVQPEFLLSK